MTCQRSACGLFFADNNSIRTTLRYEVCAFVEPFHDRYLQSSNWCVDLLGRAGVTDQLVLAEFKPGGGGGRGTSLYRLYRSARPKGYNGFQPFSSSKGYRCWSFCLKQGMFFFH